MKRLFLLFGLLYILLPLNCYAYEDVGVSENNIEQTQETKDSASDDSVNISDDYTVSLKDSGQVSVSNMPSQGKAWTMIYVRIRLVLLGITGLCSFFFVGLFVKNFIQLGASAGNPQTRKECLNSLLWTGITGGILGSAALFISLSWNSLK